MLIYRIALQKGRDFSRESRLHVSRQGSIRQLGTLFRVLEGCRLYPYPRRLELAAIVERETNLEKWKVKQLEKIERQFAVLCTQTATTGVAREARG